MNDEGYIINLCDVVLTRVAIRQHRFNFLRGDKCRRENGEVVKVFQEQGRKLPVDAYYKDLNLVIEYLEIQHFQRVPFFDDRMTCSGVPRGEQRTIYDERRRIKLKENGIILVEIPYKQFNPNNRGRLVRNEKNDELVIRGMLSQFLTK